ncbi:MAG: enoyl-CoA hydratase/isomerase family protein [Anaerolineae bacterium]
MTKPTDDILLTREGPIALITLNRPQRHNSLVPEFLQEMLAALTAVAQEPEVQAVALQANGRSFSTGGDVRGFYDHLDDIEPYAREIVGLLNQVMLAMMRLPVPVVTAVHGIVTGGSLGLALASDIVLVTPAASFTPYYSVVGFSPDGGWTAVLPQLIGLRRAAAVLMHNQTIDAETAVRWGLANRLVPAGAIRAEALAAATDLAAKKSGSLRHTKQRLFTELGGVAARLEAERTHFVRQIMTPEARQGILEFLKK